MNIFTISLHQRVDVCLVRALTEKLSCGQSNIPPSQERTPLKKANSARKAIRLTTMLATRTTAPDAPWDVASNMDVHFLRRQVMFDWSYYTVSFKQLLINICVISILLLIS